jgi:hypothetical protein
MYKTGQLDVEVHFFPTSADELAERSRRLRTLLLRGARRSIQQNEDPNQEVESCPTAGALPLDLVVK